MSSREFVYWLQGFFEIAASDKPLTKEQTKIIKNHLNMVFKHEIDPSYGDKDHQATLQEIHDGLEKKVEQILKDEAEKPPKKEPGFPHPFYHDCNPLIRC